MSRLLWSRLDAAIALVLALALLLFGLWPELDLVVSQAFWSPAQGFALDQQPLVQAVYLVTPWLGRAVLLVLLALWLTGLIRPDWVRRSQRLKVALLLGTAVFGLGLFIDAGLKDHWGRPRPRDTQQFGGAEPFQPALLPTGACQRNCSFVSGHAAVGFFIASGALLVPARRRHRWLVAGLLAGSAIGLGRIAQGGHYLSDIVFSFFAVWLSAHAVGLWLVASERWRLWHRLARRPGRMAWAGPRLRSTAVRSRRAASPR